MCPIPSDAIQHPAFSSALYLLHRSPHFCPFRRACGCRRLRSCGPGLRLLSWSGSGGAGHRWAAAGRNLSCSCCSRWEQQREGRGGRCAWRSCSSVPMEPAAAGAAAALPGARCFLGSSCETLSWGGGAAEGPEDTGWVVAVPWGCCSRDFPHMLGRCFMVSPAQVQLRGARSVVPPARCEPGLRRQERHRSELRPCGGSPGALQGRACAVGARTNRPLRGAAGGKVV